MIWIAFVALFYFILVTAGIYWLLGRKLRLIRRLGVSVTNDQLIALAKQGDIEATALRRDTWKFIFIGLLAALVLFLFKP